MAQADEKKLELQFKYIRKLKRLKGPMIRKMHKEVFRGTKYNVSIVKPHRNLLERRLLLLFMMKNYHYPKGSGPRIMFFKFARCILKEEYHPLPRKEEEDFKRREQFKQTQLFTKDNVNTMAHNQIDRYLNEFGIYVEIPYSKKRKLLWELHRLPTTKLPKTLNESGKVIDPRHLDKVRFDNQFNLRDLILENPNMCYPEFCSAYGNIMPTVSRDSFKSTRSHLKRSGYIMPDLRGSSEAVVIKGKKTKRGKTLYEQRRNGKWED